MRSIPTFLVLLVASFLLFCCHESKPVPKYPIEGAVDLNQPAPTTAGVNTSVKHYTCPNNCANSGGDGEGTCPVCGTAYVHNAAYHNNPAAGAAAAPAPTGQPITTESSTSQISLSDPNNPEPAQNAAGVWHYTCSAGCAGGAGAAGTCAGCGGALAHNASYHN